MPGETDIEMKGNTPVQLYRCAGQSYWLTEKMCNDRQWKSAWHGHKCERCSVRRGGKNDPRKGGL